MTRFRVSFIHYLNSTLVVLGFGDATNDVRIKICRKSMRK